MFQRSVSWLALVLVLSAPLASAAPDYGDGQPAAPPTTTPIKYLVVIFDEDISFDYYCATYPNATNPPGEPEFLARPDTPAVNGLTPVLLSNKPNGVAPFRLDRADNVTCDNDNHYTDEQTAYDGGLLDKFAATLSGTGAGCTPNLSMGYYDGNTVTALWNYAQHFAMSDNFFASEFDTTVMGHLNLLSGQTHGAVPASISKKVINGTVIAKVNPAADDCSTAPTIQMEATPPSERPPLGFKPARRAAVSRRYHQPASANALLEADGNSHHLR